MGSHNGGVKWQLALWNMEVVALRVIRLKSAGVIGSGGEVDIVVASAAGSPARYRQKGFGLCRAAGLAVANLATARIGGIDNRRKVTQDVHVAGNFERDAGRGRGANHAGQLRSHVDLVKENLGVQRVASDRIGILWLVAKHAHLHAVGITAVKRQLVVAGVTTLRADDIARDGNGRPIGYEVESGAGVTDAQVERGEIAVAVYRDRSGYGRVKSGGHLSLESILVLARAYGLRSAAQFEIRTGNSAQHLASHLRHGIRHVLLLAFWNVGSHVCQRHYSRSGYAGPIQRQPRRIGERVRYADDAVTDPGRVDCDRQAGPHEINQRRIRVESFVA